MDLARSSRARPQLRQIDVKTQGLQQWSYEAMSYISLDQPPLVPQDSALHDTELTTGARH
jgi:hypothetical protein